MRIKHLIIAVLAIFTLNVNAVVRGELDSGFGNSDQPGTYLFQYSSVCGTTIDSVKWDWDYVISDLASKGGYNYVSFDLYKHTNNSRLTPDVSAVAKISVSGEQNSAFICDQVPAKSSIAIDASQSVYLIADFKENKTIANGNLVEHKGLKIVGYDSGYNKYSEMGASWQYEASVGSPGFKHSINSNFTATGSLVVAASIYYQPLYLQPLSLTFDVNSQSSGLTYFEKTIENANLTFAKGSAISTADGSLFYNLSAEKLVNGVAATHSYVKKFFSNGDLDLNFGNMGYINVTPADVSYQLEAVTLLTDKSIIASGFSNSLDNNGLYSTRVVKLTETGVIDNSFANNGYLLVPVEGLMQTNTGEQSSLYGIHNLLTTKSKLIILHSLNNQTITSSTGSTNHSVQQLIVFDESGVIDNGLTTKLNKSVNLDYFSLRKMKQDDFGGLVLSGYCKAGTDQWDACIKRVNWDNKTESVTTIQNSGSGSAFWLIILLVAFRKLKKVGI